MKLPKLTVINSGSFISRTIYGENKQDVMDEEFEKLLRWFEKEAQLWSDSMFEKRLSGEDERLQKALYPTGEAQIEENLFKSWEIVCGNTK